LAIACARASGVDARSAESNFAAPGSTVFQGPRRSGLEFLEQRRAHHAGKAADDPDLLALSDLCDVILNLNEFVYVQ